MSYKEIAPGDIIKVKVTAVKPYGAFIETRDGQVGLIHISEITNCFIFDISSYIKQDEILEKYPSQLSGGEATRVGILLALLSKPKILICDEITSGLDNETKQKIINLLLSLDEKISIIFITHDILSAMKIAQKVLIIESGKQVAWGKFEDLASQNVLKKYLDAAKFYEGKL